MKVCTFNQSDILIDAHRTLFLAIPTGDSAYRAVIPRADLEAHPDLMYFLNANLGVRWMGPGSHLMTYPIRAGQASFMYSHILWSNLTAQLAAL